MLSFWSRAAGDSRRRFSTPQRGKTGLRPRFLRAHGAFAPPDNLQEIPAGSMRQPAESLGQFWGNFGPITGPQSVKEPSTRGQNPEARRNAAGKRPARILCADILRTWRGRGANRARAKPLQNADFC